MKARINKNSQIEIMPENTTEAYALKKWCSERVGNISEHHFDFPGTKIKPSNAKLWVGSSLLNIKH